MALVASKTGSGAFADLGAELTDVALEVTGRWPEGLEGTLFRVVPTAFEWPHGRFEHWFDGHGQVHAFTIAGGRVRYRDRFVETAALARSRRTGRPGSAFGTRDGGLLRNWGRESGKANTNVVRLGDRLLALQEVSQPYALDPDSLATLGPTDLGVLDKGEGMSAHPHWDPRRREVVMANLLVGREAVARVRTLDATGRSVSRFDLPLPYVPVLLHDLGVSETHVVVPVFPQVAQPLKYLAGLASWNGSARWSPDLGSHVVVAKRDGSGVRTHALPAMFAFHVLNCFDAPDAVVVDWVSYADGGIVDAIGHLPVADAQALPAGRVQRVRLHHDGRTTIDTIEGAFSYEFPRLDPRRAGAGYRYGFAVASRHAGEVAADPFASVARLDTHTGDIARWVAPEGHQVGEPVPVPKGADGACDAVWLLSVVYDPSTHRSRLVVLDGEAIEAGPVAEAHVPHHIPLGFHGNFSRG